MDINVIDLDDDDGNKGNGDSKGISALGLDRDLVIFFRTSMTSKALFS